MTNPLALVLFERVLPGSQIVNRLQDLHYRVETITDASRLSQAAEDLKPMLVLIHLENNQPELMAKVAALKQAPTTRHLPVIGFTQEVRVEDQSAASQHGFTMLVSEVAILNHLPQFLEQALHVD